MADIATIDLFPSGIPRVVCIRLKGSLPHTISTTQWAQRDCPSMRTHSLGEGEPEDIAFGPNDYVFLMAGDCDGKDAQMWSALAQTAGVAKVMVSLFRSGEGNVGDFGRDWDAFFILRGIALPTPLLIILKDCSVDCDGSYVWSMLKGRMTIVDPIGRQRPVPKEIFEDTVGLFAHFASQAPLAEVRTQSQLDEIDGEYAALRACLPSGAFSVLSVGVHCRAPSDLIIFRVMEWNSEL